MPDRTLVGLTNYNRWANARVLAHAAQLSDADRRSPVPGTAGTIELTTVHFVETELYFASLITGGDYGELAPQPSWDALMAIVEAADDALVGLADSLGDRALDRQIDRDGQPYAARDLLLQALTHSHQHRTQIAAAVDIRGVPVKATDYIDFVDATGG